MHTHNQCVLMNQILSVVRVRKGNTFPMLFVYVIYLYLFNYGNTLNNGHKQKKKRLNVFKVHLLITHIHVTFEMKEKLVKLIETNHINLFPLFLLLKLG